MDSSSAKISRRSLLKSTAIPALFGGFAGLSTASSAAGRRAGRWEIVDAFDNPTTNWKTRRELIKQEITRQQCPAGVKVGETSIAVDTDGRRTTPSVVRTVPLNGLDLASNPYVALTMLPGSSGDRRRATLTLYGYDLGSSTGDPESGSTELPDRSDALVSSSVDIQTTMTGTVAWDLSETDRNVLERVNGFEIAWLESESGDFDGGMVLDNLRVTDSLQAFTDVALGTHVRRVREEQGPVKEHVVEEIKSTTENGRFVHSADGEIGYSFEIRGSDRYKFEYGDSAYDVGGGWQ